MHAKQVAPPLRDESRIIEVENFDVEAFASRHGLTCSQAMGLVDRFGTDVDRHEREALELRRA